MNVIKDKRARRVGLWALCLVLLPALAGSRAFDWPATAQTTTPVTFAIIGDFGSDDANEAAVANLVKSWNPAFIVTVGDNNYPDGEASTIDANIGKYYHEYIHPYTGSFGAGATTNRFWPSIGNRDWENLSGPKLQPYFNYFTLPNNERYYDVVQGPVHLFILDSDSREPDGITANSVQAQWLQNRLALSTAPWKIVVLHHPPFSSRTSWSNLQWPFRQWGADVVVSGHAHIYERILKDGFPYLICGLGGESLGSFSTAIEGSMVRFGSDYGALKVTADANSITFQMITRAGVVIDTYTISRNVAAPAAPTNLSATTVSTTQIDLAWTDNSTNEDGFQVEQSTDGVNFTRIATVAPNVNAFSNTNLQPSTAYTYRVRAFAADQNSAYSNTAGATTTAGAPVAPSGLSAAAASVSQINLAWTDNSTNEENFEVERCAGAGCTNFAWVAEVAANATTFQNTGLAASTTYRYRVRATNGSGDSA
jgi:3',5'-cyclic AMP phosphodiesterase CpdA